MRKIKSKLVLVVRKDLNMSIGKVAAQVTHAIMRNPNLEPYEGLIDSGHVCITCSIKSEQKLYNLAEKAREAGVPCSIQVDSGRTEVAPNTATAMALGPVHTDEGIEVLNELTKKLQLF